MSDNGNSDGEMAETPTGTTVRDSNLLVIRGYSAAKGMGAGEYISSDEFTLGGHKWAICLYPAGMKAEDKSVFVSVHVKLASASRDVQARFELTLMDQTGKGKHKIANSGFNRSHPVTLRCRGSSWGFNRYFRRDMLEISDYLRDDCLKFCCTIEVILPYPAPTPSCSITEMPRGSKLFVIRNYSVARGMGPGECVQSDEFWGGGHKWTICFYPVSKHESSHMSVYVKLASEGKDVKAMFELALMDQTGKGKHKLLASFNRSRPYTILRRGSTWGLRFFERESLETSDYLRDDCLKIYCNIGVVSATPMHPWIKVPESDIGSHIGKLLESTESCDVTFNVSGEKFHAHKLILAARSPKLCSDLLLQGIDTKKVTVPGMEPKVFKALLQFIYTDGLDENEENVGVAETLTAKLLAAADRYELKRLKRMCESRLCRYVTQDPYQVFSLANRHHAEELRNICVEFALHNPIGEKLSRRLLAAADQTEAKKLKRLLENRMREYVTVGSVAEILALAHRCHAAELKDHCLKFAAHNLTPHDVMRLEGFKHLEEKYPSLKSELLKTVAEISDDGENSSRRIGQQTEEREVDEVLDLEDFKCLQIGT